MTRKDSLFVLRGALLNSAKMGLLLCAWGAHLSTAGAIDYTLFGFGQSGFIPRRPVVVIDPLTYSPLFGAPSIALGYPPTIGHQHIPTGPNSYVYRPISDMGQLVRLAKLSIQEADYQAALLNLEPVLKLSPNNGDAWLDESQALFGLGRYTEAATALHLAMRTLPREAWGAPVRNFRNYFRSIAEYTTLLRALEAYVKEHPDVAAGHYLLGYHYGYLGHAANAERELKAAIEMVSGEDLESPLPEVIEAPAPLPEPRGPREF